MGLGEKLGCRSPCRLTNPPLKVPVPLRGKFKLDYLVGQDFITLTTETIFIGPHFYLCHEGQWIGPVMPRSQGIEQRHNVTPFRDSHIRGCHSRRWPKYHLPTYPPEQTGFAFIWRGICRIRVNCEHAADSSSAFSEHRWDRQSECNVGDHRPVSGKLRVMVASYVYIYIFNYLVIYFLIYSAKCIVLYFILKFSQYETQYWIKLEYYY